MILKESIVIMTYFETTSSVNVSLIFGHPGKKHVKMRFWVLKHLHGVCSPWPQHAIPPTPTPTAFESHHTPGDCFHPFLCALSLPGFWSPDHHRGERGQEGRGSGHGRWQWPEGTHGVHPLQSQQAVTSAETGGEPKIWGVEGGWGVVIWHKGTQLKSQAGWRHSIVRIQS